MSTRTTDYSIENKCESMYVDRIDRKVQVRASEGWKLVSITPLHYDQSRTDSVLVGFTRKIKTSKEPEPLSVAQLMESGMS